MGRPRRVTAGGVVYHVLNRANRRARIFQKPQDYEAFLDIIGEGLTRVPCRLLGLCIMPNHWHLVLWPHGDGDLSRLMAWTTNTHVKRYRQHYDDQIGGHLYQGRFKSFPVQEDGHLLTVLRYVEANPLRCGLSSTAREWPWSSCALRESPRRSLLSDWPVPRPSEWEQLVEQRWAPAELVQLRASRDRGRPFGQSTWALEAAKRLGLESAFRNRGRPSHLETMS